MIKTEDLRVISDKPCRQCHQDYEPRWLGPFSRDDGFCSDFCMKEHDDQLGGVDTSEEEE